MTPGTIDLKIVENRLRLVTECLADLHSLPRSSLEQFTADRRNPLAADAALRRCLEALFDIARHLLARGFGCGALEYREVARQALDRGLVRDPEARERFPEMSGYRNRLTHHYEEVTPAELFAIVTSRLGDVERIARDLGEAAARLARRPTD